MDEAKKTTNNEYNTVIDALNIIDEYAENANNTYEDEEDRLKAYEIVAEFIDRMASREINN